MTTPTTPTVEDCKERFIYLSARFGYKRAWSELQKEFDHDLIRAFATQTRTPSPEGMVEATPESIKAASKWSPLLRNTEARP